jgi:hypothetical protein
MILAEELIGNPQGYAKAKTQRGKPEQNRDPKIAGSSLRVISMPLRFVNLPSFTAITASHALTSAIAHKNSAKCAAPDTSRVLAI